ncbi:MAG: ribosomal L7Ae/L30e/S12e/Gadd45 family protein [Deltaproteobacteria bacterium]
MLEELKKANKKIGIKECKKAIENDKALTAFVAQDAEERVIKPFVELCSQKAIDITYVDTMSNLGKACGIDVGAATVVMLK